MADDLEYEDYDPNAGEITGVRETTDKIPLGGFIGGLFDRLSGKSAERQQAAARSAAAQATNDYIRYLNGLPPAEDLTSGYDVFLEDPEKYLLGDSALAGAQADQRAVGAQMNALSELEDIYKQGGYTQAERAQMAQAQQQLSIQARGQRDAQLSQLGAQGQRGGGAETLARLMGTQTQANLAGNALNNIIASGMNRKFQAAQGAGQLGSRAREQSFQEEATRRGAIDEFNMNNMGYQRGVQERNTGAQNQQAAQRSTQMQGNEQFILGQQLAGTQGMANARMGQGSMAQQNAANEQQAQSDLIGSLVKIAALA